MTIETLNYINKQWQINENILDRNTIDIVFIFGDSEDIKQVEAYESLREIYGDAHIVGCSSSGNILGDELSNASIVGTAISFKTSNVQVAVKDFSSSNDQENISKKLIEELPKENLKHIFLLSDGLNMNGSFLVKGANAAVSSKIPITGGLAGDGMDFKETWVVANDVAKQNRLVAIGFYGDDLVSSSGCYAGWEEFGIYRHITKSSGNIVYEIDGKPALDLYKKYLGEYANKLPSSGLKFPFNVKEQKDSKAVIRSVLAIDEEAKSLIFAGDVQEGSYARLMKSDIDGLIDGSAEAASDINKHNKSDALGLVVSCVGRRVVLNQLTEEELEVISDTLGVNVQLTGFYSYGELAPHSNELLSCQLHNQTMTLTVIYED